eukprot:UN02178
MQLLNTISFGKGFIIFQWIDLITFAFIEVNILIQHEYYMVTPLFYGRYIDMHMCVLFLKYFDYNSTIRHSIIISHSFMSKRHCPTIYRLLFSLFILTACLLANSFLF